jgi:hypothetical protein
MVNDTNKQLQQDKLACLESSSKTNKYIVQVKEQLDRLE